MLRDRGLLTLKYLTKTEAHTFAFSVAANAILSFFPFMVLVIFLTRNVFHSQTMSDVVAQFLKDHLPTNQDFVIHSLDMLVRSRKRVKLASVVILLITSTGVFLPLEVAFNQIWGFVKNRSYLGNQLVSLALAFACGILALASIGLAAGNQWIVQTMMLGHKNIVFTAITGLTLKILATAASIGMFFLLYWILPNGKVSPASVLPAAIAMGLLWEVGRYVYVKALPWINFPEVYGPFSVSVTLMFWAFISGLMVLAGAQLASDFEPGLPDVPEDDIVEVS
ncbi:MAG TPA: YihY/virulence factor BrkB family protein [Candidatus Limnocylindrales bacterium]|nr:YihY/virulence factor BrkB family protein [Candidatus Limnocylindrales bacterium]